MTREELEALSKEELIDLVLAQGEQLAQLQAAFRQLQADYEALKLKFEQNQKPATSSQNSSQPPSRDQKGSLPKERRNRDMVRRPVTRSMSGSSWLIRIILWK